MRQDRAQSHLMLLNKRGCLACRSPAAETLGAGMHLACLSAPQAALSSMSSQCTDMQPACIDDRCQQYTQHATNLQASICALNVLS